MQTTTANGERQRVLLIEDDKDARETLAEILTDEGYHVSTAGGGFEALSRLETEALPHTILLDLMMGMMSGWEFRQRMLEQPRLVAIPVILVSAVADLPEQAANLRAAAYYRKPIDLDGLLASVRELTTAPR
jgi:CheY-like chemotaxis protein